MHASKAGFVKKVCFEKRLRDINVCGGKELLPFQSQIKWNRRNIANYIVNLKIKEQTKPVRDRQLQLTQLSYVQTDAATPNNVETLIVVLHFEDHGTKEIMGVGGWKVWPVLNFAQQHATTCNNLQQGLQTDATRNIQ